MCKETLEDQIIIDITLISLKKRKKKRQRVLIHKYPPNRKRKRLKMNKEEM